MAPHTNSPRQLLLCLAVLTLVAQGCTSITMPKTAFSKHSREYQGIDGSFDNGQTSVSKAVYQAVRQVRSEKAIVLQVIGDEDPARVLPLPPGQNSVYVSELLTQTGVIDKLEHVNATLFRHSTDSIGGIPMKVRMDKDRSAVKPESDYALQAGDRLLVSQATHPAMENLINAVLGY